MYGAYTALVYLTPFFGGLLADRLLGARRAVVLGGLLMAAGHLLMTVETGVAFFTALALLICGNGFFKPNISTMVGSLYAAGSPRRDAGFTLFYMGINLGAAMSPLLCGYIGEKYGWHYGFGLATVGMLTGLAVFVAPRRVAQVLILSGALLAAAGLFLFRPDSLALVAVNVLVGVALLLAGGVAWVALRRGGLPVAVGAPPNVERLRQRVGGVLSREWSVYLATALIVPVMMLFVSGFSPVLRRRSRDADAGVVLGDLARRGRRGAGVGGGGRRDEPPGGSCPRPLRRLGARLLAARDGEAVEGAAPAHDRRAGAYLLFARVLGVSSSRPAARSTTSPIATWIACAKPG